MAAQFDITVDPAHDIVKITLRGFFTHEVLEAFLDERRVAFGQLKCPVSDHLALTDVREMKIQSQDMVAEFGTLLANPRTQGRRLAFVVASTLARQQLQRALGHRSAQCFTSLAEAEAWLRAGNTLHRAA